MRWLNASFRKKMAIVIITVMALPALCGAVEIKVPGLNLKYGKLDQSRDVTKTFETPRVLEGHHYYYYGWGNVPYAIIAIDRQYKLRKGLWIAFEATVPILRSWANQMDSIYGYPPRGFRILDHKGTQVGVWYSSKQWTTIVIEEDNQIAVFTPEPPGFRGGK